MKRKNMILVMMLGMASIFTMQSCTKDESPTPVVYKADVPVNPTPAVDAVVPLAGTTYTLKWEGTTGAVDLHFGATEAAADKVFKVASGNTFNVPDLTGGEYFWYLQTKDANGIVSKSPVWNFYINTAPTVPVLSTPADAAVGISVASALVWTSSDAEGDAIKYDVYLGTTTTPALVATGLTAATYSPTMVASTKYYWKVVATDSHGYASTSAIYSFTTGLEPVMKFVGLFDCDEPGYKHYDVTFKKVDATTIEANNWWDSGWKVQLTLNFTANSLIIKTFIDGVYIVTGSGTINQTTGKMVENYIVTKSGAINDQNVHTYVKK